MDEFVAFGVDGFAAELKGISNFIKTRLNRLVYRDMLTRARTKRVGKRRRAINEREFATLDFLLWETEPVDPFSEVPSRQVRLADLETSPYIRSAYADVTTRTFAREMTRLWQKGFIKVINPDHDMAVEIDFDAIGKY